MKYHRLVIALAILVAGLVGCKDQSPVPQQRPQVGIIDQTVAAKVAISVPIEIEAPKAQPVELASQQIAMVMPKPAPRAARPAQKGKGKRPHLEKHPKKIMTKVFVPDSAFKRRGGSKKHAKK